MNGQIVIFNGAPRSGKSSIARALQALPDSRWINLGVDAQNAILPQSLRPGIGLRPGGERPDLEPAVVALYLALYQSIAAHARAGFDVVVDVGHHDVYSHPLGILPQCARLLAGLDVLFVGVHCPLNVIMARRNADPHGGLYAHGPGIPAPVQRWQDAVHMPGIYDLMVDTGTMTSDDCVTAIASALDHPKTAFEHLAAL